MLPAKKICVVGNNAIDLVFICSASPEADGKALAEELQVHGGGQAANSSVALAALGFGVRYIGCFGDDPFGRQCRQALDDAGVDTSCAPTVANCPNTLTSIWINRSSKDRTIVMYKDPRLRADRLAPDERWLADCAALYTDGYEPQLSLKLAAIAARRGIPVFTDAEEVSPEILELIRHSSVLLAPLRIILEIAGKIDRRAALAEVSQLGPTTVVATIGSQGAACLSDGDYFETPAAPCKPVDTTGAGDAFHSAFIAGQLSGKPLRETMTFAAKIAAIKCECAGARVSGTAIERMKKEMLALVGGNSAL